MSDTEIPQDMSAPESTPIAPELARSRARLRLDVDFVPEQTSDDLATAWGDSPLDDSAKQQSYLAEKPPHHGD